MAALYRQVRRSRLLYSSALYPRACSVPLIKPRRHHDESTGEAIKLQISPGQIWYNVNELGSKMTIESVDYKTGVFGGFYVSGVGEVDKVGYTLAGCFDTDGIAIGWAVNWKNEGMNAHSVTTWSGKLQKTNSGNPVIQTTWLLTAQTFADVNWKSTEVGSDHFCLTPI